MHDQFRRDQDQATSTVLQRTVDRHTRDDVSFGELITALQERGFGLLMVIFVLPNCVPIPVPPGFSTVFSIPLVFLSLQMLIGRPAPWLPEWLRRKTVKRATLAKLVSTISPRLKYVEKLLKPRLTFTHTPVGERIIGLFWLIFAISIAVPLPMTNFIPGIGILVMSLGLLSKDGVTVIIGMIIGMLGVAFTSAVLLLGTKVVKAFFAPLPIDMPDMPDAP